MRRESPFDLEIQVFERMKSCQAFLLSITKLKNNKHLEAKNRQRSQGFDDDMND